METSGLLLVLAFYVISVAMIVWIEAKAFRENPR
jgi:hypothetical protein